MGRGEGGRVFEKRMRRRRRDCVYVKKELVVEREGLDGGFWGGGKGERERESREDALRRMWTWTCATKRDEAIGLRKIIAKV